MWIESRWQAEMRQSESGTVPQPVDGQFAAVLRANWIRLSDMVMLQAWVVQSPAAPFGFPIVIGTGLAGTEIPQQVGPIVLPSIRKSCAAWRTIWFPLTFTPTLMLLLSKLMCCAVAVAPVASVS